MYASSAKWGSSPPPIAFVRLILIFRYVRIAMIISIETYKEVTQLVSTSNKRSSSVEMKIDLKGVGLYSGEGLDT